MTTKRQLREQIKELERDVWLAWRCGPPNAPWGGDRSVPAGTLCPWYVPEDEKPCPWPGWEFRKELAGWQGVPRWAVCVNGQTADPELYRDWTKADRP